MLAGIIVAFVLTAFALATLVRGAITWPLGALAEACRTNHRRQFQSSGSSRRAPSDICAIASDVEDMRRRIVDELDSAGQARPCSTSRPRNCAGPTPSWSSSPTWPPTTCRSRCARSPSFCQLLEKRYGDQLDERGIQYIDFAVDGAKRMSDPDQT